MSFFEELKRRNVFRVGIAYGVASWVILQIADLILEAIEAPGWVLKALLMFVVLGFAAALVIAWAYEITPDGIRKEADVDRSQSVVADTGRKMDRIIIGFLVVAVAVLLYRQSGNGSDEPEAPPSLRTTDTIQVPTSEEPGASGTAPESSVSADIKQSIAVLPFVNMSSDPEQEYFSDGLSEELLNRLAKNDQLHVAARTSAFQFKGQNLDISDIGRQLKVAHVLEGSVRKAGNRLRITAQLIQVDNGFHLWSETYEREMDDVFAIQDEIAVAISEAMEIELGTSSNLVAGSKPTSNLEAYNLYLQARHLLAQRGGENMLAADRLFAQAVELDPDFSAAWSGKAFNASLLSGYSIGTTHQEGLDKTLEAAGHALELDPENAEAYTAIGRVMSDDMQWEEARKNFERAFELDPNDVGVLNLYADFLGLRLGDFDRGISLEQQAISLDPLSGVHASDLADLLLVKGQFEDAVVSARRGVSLAPDSAQRMYSFVESLVKSGKLEEAASLLKRLSTPDPEYAVFKSSLKQWWAAYYYASDDLESLQTFVAECIQTKESGAEDPNCMSLSFAQIAYFSMRWQDPASVVPWLEKSLEERESDLTFPLYFYLPERISDDPRWLEFWNQPVLKALLDIRRANPYPSNGLSRAKSEISGTDK